MIRLAQGLRYINNQVKDGFNPICVFVGRIRVGKSWMACGIAQILQPFLDGTEWDVNKQLFIDFDKFISSLDNMTKKVVIFDEAGYSLGSKEWYSKFNKGMNKILQTQGFRSNVVILILPMLIQLAKDHRRMVDVIFHVKSRGFSKVMLVKRKYEELYNDAFKIWRLNPIKWKPTDKQRIVLEKYDEIIGNLKKSIPKAIRDGKPKKKKLTLEEQVYPDFNVKMPKSLK